MARERYFLTKVLESKLLCPLVTHVTFEREDGQPFAFRPGQFVMIHFPDHNGVEINRSYSLSSLPEEPMALCVKKVEGGQGSTLIHNLKAGDTIKTSGPYGRFCLPKSAPKHIALIATGTGIAPYRAMLPQLRALLEEGHVIWLLFGVRYVRELLYHDEWLGLAEEYANFFYRPVVSRPEPDEGWGGSVGYVRVFLDEMNEEVLPAEDSVVYLCGVPEMIDEMRDVFLERGLSRRAIKTEKYVSPPPPGAKKIAPPA